jgi:hypothetical protein
MGRHCRLAIVQPLPVLCASNSVEQLTRQPTHRCIFMVAKIRPAPEIRCGLFYSDKTLSTIALAGAPKLATATNRTG